MHNKFISRANRRRVKFCEQTQLQSLRELGRVRERAILGVIVDACNAGMVPYMRNYQTKIVTNREGKNIFAKLPLDQLGKPDITVICRAGAAIWIETKSWDGVLSDDQKRWRDWLQLRGHEYYAPNTIAHAHSIADRILELGR